MNTTLNSISFNSLRSSQWLIACLQAMDDGVEICFFEGYGQ